MLKRKATGGGGKRKKLCWNRMRYEAKNDIIWSVLVGMVGSPPLTCLESLFRVNSYRTDKRYEEMPQSREKEKNTNQPCSFRVDINLFYPSIYQRMFHYILYNRALPSLR